MQKFYSAPTGKCQLQYSTISKAPSAMMTPESNFDVLVYSWTTRIGFANSCPSGRALDIIECVLKNSSTEVKVSRRQIQTRLNWIKNSNFECEAVKHFGAIDNRLRFERMRANLFDYGQSLHTQILKNNEFSCIALERLPKTLEFSCTVAKCSWDCACLMVRQTWTNKKSTSLFDICSPLSESIAL